jgi:hypothetical protein
MKEIVDWCDRLSDDFMMIYVFISNFKFNSVSYGLPSMVLDLNKFRKSNHNKMTLTLLLLQDEDRHMHFLETRHRKKLNTKIFLEEIDIDQFGSDLDIYYDLGGITSDQYYHDHYPLLLLNHLAKMIKANKIFTQDRQFDGLLVYSSRKQIFLGKFNSPSNIKTIKCDIPVIIPVNRKFNPFVLYQQDELDPTSVRIFSGDNEISNEQENFMEELNLYFSEELAKIKFPELPLESHFVLKILRIDPKEFQKKGGFLFYQIRELDYFVETQLFNGLFYFDLYSKEIDSLSNYGINHSHPSNYQ